MVEIGVQTVFDDVLRKNKRGHLSKETIEATKLLKDAGFKVMYQMMPNLPYSNVKKDLDSFKIIFNNQKFKPDWLKIYPCLVCRGSKLYGLWKRGQFKPYSDKQLIELLVKIKKTLPYWVRMGRLFRDIPGPEIKAGCKISNLREVVKKETTCKCIRCREIKGNYKKEKLYLFRENYDGSDGKEIFLSFENKKRRLYAFLRLRIPSAPFVPVLKNSAIIRELHTFGQLSPIKDSAAASPQHKGLGKGLVKEAEKIAQEEFGISKIAVISGVGVRGYYRKLGYRLKNTYMIKTL